MKMNLKHFLSLQVFAAIVFGQCGTEARDRKPSTRQRILEDPFSPFFGNSGNGHNSFYDPTPYFPDVDMSMPSGKPTMKPTPGPSGNPTPYPTSGPTPYPTGGPTDRPSPGPTGGPTKRPSLTPAPTSTDSPSLSQEPSVSSEPSVSNEPSFSAEPTVTGTPSSSPSLFPSTSPSDEPTPSPTDAPTNAGVGGTVVTDLERLELTLFGISNFNGLVNRATWEAITATYIQGFYAHGDFGATNVQTAIDVRQVNGNIVSDTVNRKLQQQKTDVRYNQALSYTLTDGAVTPELVAILPFCSPLDRAIYVDTLSNSGNQRLSNVVDTSIVTRVNGSVPPCPGTIVDVASAAPDLSTLVGLVAGIPTLLDLLSEGPGPLTVFAPTNTAFERLEDALGIAIEDVPTDVISRILEYHIYEGRLFSKKLEDGIIISINELGALVANDGSTITVNTESLVLDADILTSNGVVHVIDDVLLPPGLDLIDTAASFEIFTTLLTALDITELDDALRGDGPFTLFAPTDDAFNKLGQEVIDDLINNPDALRDILLYHVSPGILGSNHLVGIERISTLLPGRTISVSPNGKLLNGVVAFEFNDVIATNGVLQAIDTVLDPNSEGAPDILEFVEVTNELSTLEQLLDEQPELRSVLSGPGPLTLFAPTNAAWNKLEDALGLTVEDLPLDVVFQLLSYHVYQPQLLSTDLTDGIITSPDGLGLLVDVSPDGILLNGESDVVGADNLASNGVVHLVGNVLIPPGFDLIETAATFDIFNTLLFTLDATDLDIILREDGPFTLFAPTDDAFAKLGQGAIDDLLMDLDTLREILLYHVASGFIASADLAGLQTIPTQADGKVITTTSSGLFLNGNVGFLFTDAVASNGVLHAIDTVLDPRSSPGLTVVGTAGSFGIFTSLLAALELTGLDDVLNGDGPFTLFAPTDDAFAALGGTLTNLLNDPAALERILLYHVANGIIGSTDLPDNAKIPTLLPGTDINVSPDGSLLNEDVTFFFTDAIATNGIVHGINAVLDPNDSDGPPTPAPVVPTSSPISLLPPTPPPTLEPTQAPVPTPPTAAPISIAPVAPGSTIADVIAPIPQLSILNELLADQPGLVALLSGPGSFTLFAPSNTAFDNVEDEFGVRVEDATLATQEFILQFHVYEPALLAADFDDDTFIRSANGNATLVTTPNGGVTLVSPGNPRPSSVVVANTVASNGVIHIIDNVLLTASSSLPQEIEANGDLSFLLAALQSTGLDVALREQGPFTVFAPTNDAFFALPQDVIDVITDPANVAILERILLYHVSPQGFLGSGDLANIGPGTVSTLIPDRFITINDAGTVINGDVTFFETNIAATNGVIHKINSVLNPDP